MSSLRRRYGVYPLLAFIILATSVTMRTAACLVAFDFRWGYYTSGLGDASLWVAGIGALLLFTYAFTAKRDTGFVASFTTPATYIPTGILATALFFASRELFRSTHVATGMLPTVASYAAIAAAVLGLFAIGYFVLCAVIDKRHNLMRANFGLFAVLFFCVCAAYLYYDTKVPINAPNKMADQLALLFTAIFFLYETRISLGREKWGAYTAFGFVAIILTAYASIPELIAYFAKGEVLSDSIYTSVMTFAVFVFITARVIIAGIIPIDGEAEFVTRLKAAAAKRTEALTECEAQSEPSEAPWDEVQPEEAPEPEQVSFDIPEDSKKEETTDDTDEVTEE